MRYVLLKKIGYATMGCFFLVASGAMARYYLTYDEKNAMWRDKTKTLIADRLTFKWLKPELGDLSEQFSKGPLDRFDMIVINAAMGRWRVKEIAPHAYATLISDFKKGWWDNSFVDELTPMLKEIDRKWIEARTSITLNGNNQISPELKISSELGFGLHFEPDTTTAQIGSLIEVLFTIGPGSTPQDYAMAYWATKSNSDISPWRSKRCTMVDTKETSAGLKIYRASVDMSDCAEWIYPDTQPIVILLFGNPPVKWSPFAYTLKDSPLLPLGLDEKTTKGLSPDSK